MINVLSLVVYAIHYRFITPNRRNNFTIATEFWFNLHGHCDNTTEFWFKFHDHCDNTTEFWLSFHDHCDNASRFHDHCDNASNFPRIVNHQYRLEMTLVIRMVIFVCWRYWPDLTVIERPFFDGSFEEFYSLVYTYRDILIRYQIPISPCRIYKMSD